MDSAGIPWYSTGTVNVTQGSSNVAGVGTNWVNAGLKVGDIFTIDKSRLYQITAVNSNTSLSLQEAYQGATGTSQVYFVIRNFAGTMQAQIAAQVSELVNKYESYIDTELKQITGPAGPTSFPYRGTWTTGRTYNGLDVVQYGNQLYMALYGHTSTSANAPGATGTAWTQLTFDAAFSATKAEIESLKTNKANNGGGNFGDAAKFDNYASIGKFQQGNAVTGVRVYGEHAEDALGVIGQSLVFNGRDKTIKQYEKRATDNSWVDVATYTADEDTGWITLESEYMDFQYRKKNGFIFLVYASPLKLALQVGTTKIAQLPAGYGSSNNILTASCVSDLSAQVLVMINDNSISFRTTTTIPVGKTIVVNSVF